MNAKQVLNKIIATLSLSKEEVTLAYAKLADGTILESPTFDVGEGVSVVSEDGTKSAAPNGEHEIVLKDSEGNEVRIKVFTEDGVITERENVELPIDAKSDEVPVEKLPEDMESIAGDDIGGAPASDEEDETAEPITEDMGKVMEKLQYRISELEKKIQSMEEGMYPKDSSEDKKEEDVQMSDEEEELPKLDGAPIEENPSTKQQKSKFSKKVEASSQNSFLSRLYK
jgi:type IV secretory pathway VirB10-like protein